MSQNILLRARAMHAAMSAKMQIAYSSAWETAQTQIEASAPKGAKAYEVHHQVTHARGRYLAAMVDGKTPETCAAEALAKDPEL
jgi:hypothetical protein